MRFLTADYLFPLHIPPLQEGVLQISEKGEIIAIFENRSINLFNNGNHTRSFTYIEDIVEPMHRLIKNNYRKNGGDIISNNEIFNIGGAEPVKLLKFISIIEKYLGKKAKIKLKPIQQGDVKETNADITKLENITGYKPQTDIDQGIKKFIDWYKNYYQSNI